MTIYLSNRDGNGKTNEEGHYRLQTRIFSGFNLYANDLKVTQASPLSMNVLVTAGDYRLEVAAGYSYTGWLDVDSTVTITTADPANPRITTVVLYVDKGATTSASPPNNPGIAKLMAVNGTPAGVPSAPSGSAIQSAVGSGNPYYILANITVGTGATQITNADITDLRTQMTLNDNLVSSGAVQASAITAGKIATDAVTSTKIQSSAVTTAKIADGAVTPVKWSNPYKFSAYRNAAQSPANGVIQYDTELFDTNNNFDITTNKGRYTAPVTGFYQFNVVSSQNVSAAPQDPVVALRKNGTTLLAYSHFVNMYNGGSQGSANLSILVSLTAGDYVEVVGSNLSLAVGVHLQSFSGFLVSQT